MRDRETPPSGALPDSSRATVRLRAFSFALTRGVYPWVVMIGGFLLFQLGRGMANEIGPAPITGGLAAIDRWLGFGELPTVRLQRWHNDGGVTLARAIHLTFFLLPLALGIALSIRRKANLFTRYANALVVAFAIGFLMFSLAPTAPPWFANPEVRMLLIPDPDPSFRLRADPNPFAAVPSMHVAVATISAAVLATRFRLIPVAYVISMVWALAYLGEHYIVDSLAGFTVGLVAWTLAPRLLPGPPAPTPGG